MDGEEEMTEVLGTGTIGLGFGEATQRPFLGMGAPWVRMAEVRSCLASAIACANSGKGGRLRSSGPSGWVAKSTILLGFTQLLFHHSNARKMWYVS